MKNESPTRGRDDVATLVAIGVAAATLAAIAHETLGHGGACVAQGGRITLLTSIHFHCSHWSALTDAGGPLGNLLAGLAALAALKLGHRGPALRMFLVLLAGLNLYWFAGQTIYSGVLGVEDLAYVARNLSWPQSWRLWAVVVGVVSYAAVRRTMIQSDVLSLFRSMSVPLAAGVVSALSAALLWPQYPWASAKDALLALGVCPFPMWIATIRARNSGTNHDEMPPIGRSWAWMIAGFGLFLVFALVQGRGVLAAP